MTKMTEVDKKARKAAGINMKQMRACQLRSEGMTQIDAYCLSHKVKRGEGKVVENAAFRLFQKVEVREYLRQLWEAKPLEEIITRQDWIGTVLDDIQRCREAKNWNGVANLQRQVGLAIAALREGGGGVVIDAPDRIREIIEAFAGEDSEQRKAIELITGKVGPRGELFEPTLVVDNDGAPRLPRGVQKDKGE